MIVLDYSKTRSPLRVWATGDWHAGHINHDTPRFIKHYARAKEEHWLLLHIGDALEMVTPASRVALRGALAEQISDPESQRKYLITLLKPLVGGVILPGNHEFRVDMVSGLDFIATITDAVGKTFRPMTEPGFVQVKVGAQSYMFFLHHGEGPVAAVTTLFDRIQRDTEGVDAILCGHVHQALFQPVEVYGPQGLRVVQRYRVGHYLKRPEYAATKPTAPIGAPGSWLLTLDPKEHRLVGEWLQ